MLIRLLRAAWPAALACTFGLQPAHADIYTWLDASGVVNVSNLAPPEGARVTNIIRASVPKNPTRDDTRQAEIQALAERVLALEDEIELAKRQAPPPVEYRAIPAPPPPMQYGGYSAPPPVQYAVSAAQPTSPACDLTLMDCGVWWGPGFYPASIIVLRAPNFHRFLPGHGGRRVTPPHPMHASSGFSRR